MQLGLRYLEVTWWVSAVVVGDAAAVLLLVLILTEPSRYTALVLPLVCTSWPDLIYDDTLTGHLLPAQKVLEVDAQTSIRTQRRRNARERSSYSTRAISELDSSCFVFAPSFLF